MRKKVFLIVGAYFLFHSLVFGEEEKEKKTEAKKEPEITVVVSASRTEKSVSELGKSIEVIGHKEISNRGYKTLSEVLVNSPGMFINRTGGYGGETGIYLRGSKTEQVLMMVDGIEVNEPMGIGRGAQAELISLGDVEQIEVVRGPTSVLYGSDAIAGVINIISRKPKSGRESNLYLEGGSFESYQELANFYIGRDNYWADFSVNNFTTEGISTASILLGNKERDGYENLSFSVRAGAQVLDWLELELIGKAISSKTDLDAVNFTTGLPEDDPNYIGEGTKFLYGAKASFYTGNFKQKLEFSYTDHLKTYKDEVDYAHPTTSLDGDYKSTFQKFGWQGELLGDENNSLIFGIEYEQETGESKVEGESDWGPYQDEFPEKSIITRSGFMLWDFHKPAFGLLVGGRVDDNENFGFHRTGELSGYFQPLALGPRFRASIGTGFKSPSLYQLYGMVGGYLVGNPDLKPEQSWSKEIGLDQELLEGKVKLSATYFDIDYSDLIIWDNVGYSYNNIAEARAKGFEAGVITHPIPSLDLKLTYTSVDAKDSETDEKLIRRWGEKYSLGIAWRPHQRLELNLWGVHRGKTEDDIFSYPPERVELEPWTVVNASVRYQVSKPLSLNFRAENIFDEEYYEVYGYGTMPQTFYLGISYNFEGK